MKKYPKKDVPTHKISFTKYRIVVPTDKDRKEILEASRHIHDSDTDKNFIVINQLSHEYLEGKNVIVDQELYRKSDGLENYRQNMQKLIDRDENETRLMIGTLEEMRIEKLEKLIRDVYKVVKKEGGFEFMDDADRWMKRVDEVLNEKKNDADGKGQSVRSSVPGRKAAKDKDQKATKKRSRNRKA